MLESLTEFDPVLFSHEECAWLLDNIDKPPVVALRDRREGVNPNAVKPLLERLQELEDLRKHENIAWAGFEPLKDAIRTYLNEDAKWLNDKKRSKRAPRFPSLYSFDGKGRAHLGGPGSDAGRVRTYFKPDGSRVPFAVPLIPDYRPDWQAPGHTEQPTAGLVIDDDKQRIECFCGHTESFKSGSRSSKAAARARISKHLRKATEEVDRHREIHTNEFGG